MKITYLPRYVYRVLKCDQRKIPKYKSPKEPKIAFCLYGLVGGVRGKSGDNVASSEEVLRLAHKHYKKHIFDINNNVDVFIHTWSVDLKDKIEELYQPKRAIFQEQISFEIPDYVVGEMKRKQNHYSRWYSTKRVVELKKQYEEDKGFQYDYVFLVRFDIAWQKDLDFSRFDPQYFYTSNWYTQKNILWGTIPIYYPVGYPYLEYGGLMDIWFISNSENMDIFASLFDHLNEYNKEGNCLKSKYGISNHSLVIYHLQQTGLVKKLRFYLNKVSYWWFPAKFQFKYGPKESTPLIRRKYYGCKK